MCVLSLARRLFSEKCLFSIFLIMISPAIHKKSPIHDHNKTVFLLSYRIELPESAHPRKVRLF